MNLLNHTTSHRRRFTLPLAAVLSCLLMASQAAAAELSQHLSAENAVDNGYFLVLHEDAATRSLWAPLPQSGIARTVASFDRAYSRTLELRRFAQQEGLDAEIFWIANALWVHPSTQARRNAELQRFTQHASVQRVVANPLVRNSLPKIRLETEASRADSSALPLPRDSVPGGTLAPSALRAPTTAQTLIGSPQMWALGFRGENIVIAGEDTGYAWQHSALQASYRGWNGTSADHNYNWKDGIIAAIKPTGIPGGTCGLNSQAPCDDGSHGTHTMGTMVGDDGAGEQVGAAPGAKWIGCRNMDRGDGRVESYLRCMQWMLAPTDLAGNSPDPTKSPDVINNSWGCPPSESCGSNEFALLDSAMEQLNNAGILFVSAAGNSGSACSTIADPPATSSFSFSVGNTTVADVIAGSSSRGPVTVDASNRRKPDVSAPGTAIRSTIPPNTYADLNGTSMAAPHVAGAAALLMNALPQLRRNPQAVIAALQGTARPVSIVSNPNACGNIAIDVYPNNHAGFGRINVFDAYQRVLRNGFE